MSIQIRRNYDALTRAAVLLMKHAGPDAALSILTWIDNDLREIEALSRQFAATTESAVREHTAPLRAQLDAPSNRFEIPRPPIVGTQLRDRYGYGWIVGLDQDVDTERWGGEVPREIVRAPQLDDDPDPIREPAPGAFYAWGALAIEERGHFDVVPQDPEDARLYGPIGERWGDPTQPCPYTGCALKLGHIGPHVDAGDQDISPTDSEPVKGHNPVICTCGHPDNHRPGCPRFVMARGAIDPTTVIPAPSIGAASETLAAALEAVADQAEPTDTPSDSLAALLVKMQAVKATYPPGYCRHCDVFVGADAVGVVIPPDGKDLEWLASHCWLCERPVSELCPVVTGVDGQDRPLRCGRYLPCTDHGDTPEIPAQAAPIVQRPGHNHDVTEDHAEIDPSECLDCLRDDHSEPDDDEDQGDTPEPSAPPRNEGHF